MFFEDYSTVKFAFIFSFNPLCTQIAQRKLLNRIASNFAKLFKFKVFKMYSIGFLRETQVTRATDSIEHSSIN